MKKLLFLLALGAIGTLSTNKASAQITGVSAYFTDSINNYNSCAIPYNGMFYINGQLTGTAPTADSVTIEINFGDGTDSIFKAGESVYQGVAYFGVAIYHNFMIAGSFAPVATVTTSNSLSNTATAQPLVVSNTCANLSGQLYVDENSNCTYDAGTDVALYYVPIMAINSTVGDTMYSWADATGAYSINLPSGYTYSIVPEPGASYYSYASVITPTCPASNSASVTIGGSAVTQNFGFSCVPSDSADLFAQAWANCYRPGYARLIEVYAGTYWNTFSCANIGATVTLTLDSRLTYVSYDTAWSTAPTVSGNTVTWNWASGTTLSDIIGSIYVTCDPSATIGDTICNTITITSSTPDPNMSNNTTTFCAPITNSFDPNSKQVSPQGQGAAGYIANGTPLNYIINFQNTGTDVAYNVTITDTLNANLDVNSVRLDKASADVTVSTLPGNILTFRFNNINLPDNTANSAGSHGYVAYTVMPKSNLAPGTPINNQAHIYFDYNSAVNTNTTLNTINITTGIQHIASGNTKVSVFPNPANEQIFVKADDNKAITVSMIDMLGRVINYSQNESGNAVIDTHSLAEGMYMIKVTVNGKELNTKVNIQH